MVSHDFSKKDVSLRQHRDVSEISSSIERIKSQVLEKIVPTESEISRLEFMKSEILKLVETCAAKLSIPDVIAISVGSAERKTWLRGNHDIDIFISFPNTLFKKEMTEMGYAIAQEVAKTADSWEDRHAEHPYLHIQKDGFKIDLVPCFRVSDASKIQSAVDRTPFHCNFIKPRISGLENEVLLLKQFMKNCGVYGSEVRTGGFSGYLAELLILVYGSFENVLKEASYWRPGVRIDISDISDSRFSDPLIVIDPTDPNRNVAAALSLDKFSEFIVYARHFLSSPSIHFFFKESVSESDVLVKRISSIIKKRKSYFFGIKFSRPALPEDTVYPQLFKAEKSLWSILVRYDFVPISSFVYAGDKDCFIIFETFYSTLPSVEILQGPPVFSLLNSERFYEKYATSPETYSLYVKNGCYVAHVTRRFSKISDLVQSKIHNEIGFGKDLRQSLKSDYEFIEDGHILNISDKVFLQEMWKHLSKKI